MTEKPKTILFLGFRKQINQELKFRIYNGTAEKMDDLEKWALEAISEVNLKLPNFYLMVAAAGADGVTFTNLDRPTIHIIYANQVQFKRVLIHELMHLWQHKQGYEDEQEAHEVEVASALRVGKELKA